MFNGLRDLTQQLGQVIARGTLVAVQFHVGQLLAKERKVKFEFSSELVLHGPRRFTADHEQAVAHVSLDGLALAANGSDAPAASSASPSVHHDGAGNFASVSQSRAGGRNGSLSGARPHSPRSPASRPSSPSPPPPSTSPPPPPLRRVLASPASPTPSPSPTTSPIAARGRADRAPLRDGSASDMHDAAAEAPLGEPSAEGMPAGAATPCASARERAGVPPLPLPHSAGTDSQAPPRWGMPVSAWQPRAHASPNPLAASRPQSSHSNAAASAARSILGGGGTGGAELGLPMLPGSAPTTGHRDELGAAAIGLDFAALSLRSSGAPNATPTRRVMRNERVLEAAYERHHRELQSMIELDTRAITQQDEHLWQEETLARHRKLEHAEKRKELQQYILQQIEDKRARDQQGVPAAAQHQH